MGRCLISLILKMYLSTVGLESSPSKEKVAGLCANEARYYMNKCKHVFTVETASESQSTIDYGNKNLLWGLSYLKIWKYQRN